MKIGLKQPILLWIWLIFTISCKKVESASDSAAGCISESTTTPGSLSPSLTQAQLDVINTLYRQNNLSTADQQFFAVDSNSFVPFGYSTEVDQVMVLSYRWYNNLPVFRWNDNVTFYNGILQPSIIYTGPAPAPNPIFQQSLTSLHTIWLDNFMKVTTSWPIGNDRVTYPNASYRDTCLTARPGYLDAGYFTSNLAFANRFVKAWAVAPAGGYPMVFIEDSTGAAWPVPVYIP
jgi:hypothetical protein